MKKHTKAEATLLNKLLKVEEGEEVSLTPEEAQIYRADFLDILPDEDLEIESDNL